MFIVCSCYVFTNVNKQNFIVKCYRNKKQELDKIIAQTPIVIVVNMNYLGSCYEKNIVVGAYQKKCFKISNLLWGVRSRFPIPSSLKKLEDDPMTGLYSKVIWIYCKVCSCIKGKQWSNTLLNIEISAIFMVFTFLVKLATEKSQRITGSLKCNKLKFWCWQC